MSDYIQFHRDFRIKPDGSDPQFRDISGEWQPMKRATPVVLAYRAGLGIGYARARVGDPWLVVSAY